MDRNAPVMRPDVAKYLRALAETGADPILKEMHALASERQFPIVGPEVGRFLYQTARLLQARRIFEMGSGFGYSTLWFARALEPGGRVYHTDGDPENTMLARDFLGRSGVLDRVEFATGDAREVLKNTSGEFDILFCDIDKHQYPSALKIFRDRVRIGGAVIIDNLIWSGSVAAGEQDADTAGIAEYLERMWHDAAFVSSLLPVRDGVGFSVRVA